MALDTKQRAALNRRRKQEGYTALKGKSLDDIGIGLKKNKDYVPAKEFNKKLQDRRKRDLDRWTKNGWDVNEVDPWEDDGRTHADRMKQESRRDLNYWRQDRKTDKSGYRNKKFIENQHTFGYKRDNEKLAQWLAANKKGGKSGRLEAFVNKDGKLETRTRMDWYNNELTDDIYDRDVLHTIKGEKRLNRRNRKGIKDPKLKETSGLRAAMFDRDMKKQMDKTGQSYGVGRATGRVAKKMEELNKRRGAKIVPEITDRGRVVKYGFQSTGKGKYTGNINKGYKPGSGNRYGMTSGKATPTADQQKHLKKLNKQAGLRNKIMRWVGQ